MEKVGKNKNNEFFVHHGFNPSLSNIFIICIVLNVIYVFVEAGVGFVENSLGLLSDAGHNLGDVFSMLLTLLAFHLAKTQNHHNMFGYKKVTIFIAVLNVVILLLVVAGIIIESIYKFRHPDPLDGVAIVWTAGAGIVVNGLTTYILRMSQKTDTNVRSAYLNMLTDTFVSIAVVISGIVIICTGYSMFDTIVSLVIAGVILISAVQLLIESVRLSNEAIPENARVDELITTLRSLPHVVDVHQFHVWDINANETALTSHIIIDDISNAAAIKTAIKNKLNLMGIMQSTLEIESETHNDL